MAIVINTAPANTASVNDELLFVVYEATKVNDPTTYPDYRYVADVYVDDVFIGREIVRPDPLYKRGVFDVSKLLQSYVTYGLKANYSNATESYTAKINYKMKFGEEYGDTLYTNITVDSTSREAYKSYAIRPFDNSDVIDDVDGKGATNMPHSTTNPQAVALTNYKESKWQLLPFFDNVSGINDFVYQPFDKNNSAVDISRNISTAGYVAKTIIQANIGFKKLFSGLTAEQQAAIAWMTVNTPEAAGTSYIVNFVCTKYTPITLAWLNPYGAYDSYTFGLVSKKTNRVTKKDFAQLNYRLNASGEVSYSADGVYYGSKKGFASDVMVSLKLTSHLLNEAEYTWLADMFNSPDVYLFDSARDKFHPVTIVENDYDLRNYLNSRLIPLEFNVQFSDNYNAQYL